MTRIFGKVGKRTLFWGLALLLVVLVYLRTAA